MFSILTLFNYCEYNTLIKLLGFKQVKNNIKAKKVDNLGNNVIKYCNAIFKFIFIEFMLQPNN